MERKRDTKSKKYGHGYTLSIKVITLNLIIMLICLFIFFFGCLSHCLLSMNALAETYKCNIPTNLWYAVEDPDLGQLRELNKLQIFFINILVISFNKGKTNNSG